MITAAKAKYLANGQLSEVDNYLKKYIEPAIMNNARQGMSHCVVHTGSFPLDSERENGDFANSIIARLN